jgi:hypothetical protein
MEPKSEITIESPGLDVLYRERAVQELDCPRILTFRLPVREKL